ncbi:MAG: O-antigen polymerase, partial [Nitrososphaeraceae archaeon]|nr:O-antigen polymerase [Nitrososphaeraceae archaeon]
MEYLNSKFVRSIFLFIQSFVLFTILFDVLNQGFSIHDIFFNLMSTSSSYIALRYSGALQESIVTRLGTVFTYVGVMLGGFVFCFSKSNFRKFLIVFISLLPSILLMVVQGAKGALFLCMFLFYGSAAIYRLYNGDTALTNKKINKAILYSLVFLVPAVISSFLSRGLYDQDIDYIIQKLKMYLRSYAFAHLYAFSDWFGAYIGGESLMQFDDINNESEYGFYTFMAIFKALGSDKYVPPGVFDEYYAYKEVIKSNIYTMYRGVILDFGIIGSLVFSFALGFALNLVYFLICVLRSPLFFISVYIAMFGFYYTSFIISIFI